MTPSLKKGFERSKSNYFVQLIPRASADGHGPQQPTYLLTTIILFFFFFKRSSDKLQCSFWGVRKSMLFHDEIEALTMLRGTSEALQPKPVFFET